MVQGSGFGSKEVARFLRECEEAEEAAFAAATKVGVRQQEQARYVGVDGGGRDVEGVAVTGSAAKALAMKYVDRKASKAGAKDASKKNDDQEEAPEQRTAVEVGRGGELLHHAGNVSVLGQVREHALSVQPPKDGYTDIVLPLDGQYSRFTVAAALDDSIAGAAGTVVFTVLSGGDSDGDASIIWQSKPLRTPRDVDRCLIDVFSVHKLTLRVSCAGDCRDAFGVWVEPTLSGQGVASLVPGLLLHTGGTDGATNVASMVPGLRDLRLGTLVTLDVFDEHAPKSAAAGNTVRVRFLDQETGLNYEKTVPFDQARRVDRVYGSSVTSLGGLQALAAATHDHVARHEARRAVTTLLRHWPGTMPLNEATLGGAQQLVRLAKLVAASQGTFLRGSASATAGDDLSGGSGGGGSDGGGSGGGDGDASGGALGQLRSVMRDLLRQTAAGESESSLASVLVKECVEHFVSSTTTTDVQTVESLHPHPNSASFGGCVRFPGAIALRVTFSSKCATRPSSGSGSNRYTSALSIYKSEEHDAASLVAKCEGMSKWAPVTVYGDSLWWRFSSNQTKAAAYGFRFYVTPVAGRWTSEVAVADVASLEWACWVLSFLLSQGAVQRGAVHNQRMYDALVRYLRTKGTPTRMKPAVVGLLTRLLVSPEMFDANDAPNLSSLDVRGSTVCVLCQCRHCLTCGCCASLHRVWSSTLCERLRTGPAPSSCHRASCSCVSWS